MNYQQKNKLKKLDKKIAGLERILVFSPYFKPLNLQQEKKKFLNSNSYNPVFKYKRIETDKIKDAINELQSLGEIKDSFIAKVLQRKKNKLIQKGKMILARSTADLNRFYLWGKIDEKLENKAIQIVKNYYQNNKKRKNKYYTEEETLRYIQNSLQKYDLNWKVLISDKLTSRSALNNDCLRLRKGFKFLPEQLEGMLHHEIETHYFRQINGKKQKWKVFEKGTAGYLMLGESLATINKMIFRKKPYLRSASLLYLSVLWGEKASFREVYDEFLNFKVSPEQAFIHVLRAKKGVEDTSQPISFKKEIVYLQGFYKMLKFLRNNPEFSLEDFYLGKIGLFEVENLKKHIWEKENLLIPQYVLKNTYKSRIFKLGEFNGL